MKSIIFYYLIIVDAFSIFYSQSSHHSIELWTFHLKYRYFEFWKSQVTWTLFVVVEIISHLFLIIFVMLVFFLVSKIIKDRSSMCVVKKRACVHFGNATPRVIVCRKSFCFHFTNYRPIELATKEEVKLLLLFFVPGKWR